MDARAQIMMRNVFFLWFWDWDWDCYFCFWVRFVLGLFGKLSFREEFLKKRSTEQKKGPWREKKYKQKLKYSKKKPRNLKKPHKKLIKNQKKQ
jgi:hypothetical protein